MLHVFTMQKKLNSVINKLVLVAQRKMSGSYKSSYRIRALVCLLGYGGLFFFQRLLPMRCFPRQAKVVLFALWDEWSQLRGTEVLSVFLMKVAAGSGLTHTS